MQSVDKYNWHAYLCKMVPTSWEAAGLKSSQQEAHCTTHSPQSLLVGSDMSWDPAMLSQGRDMLP